MGTFISTLKTDCLAHELGHSLGMSDVYSFINLSAEGDVKQEVYGPLDSQVLDDSRDRGSSASALWHYRTDSDRKRLLTNALMYGQTGDDRRDIPSGSMLGYTNIYCPAGVDVESCLQMRQVGRLKAEETYGYKQVHNTWDM